MAKQIDLTDRTFGILTVKSLTDKKKYARHHAVWLCKCQCGRTKELTYVELRTAKSCGCLKQRSEAEFGLRNKGRKPANTLAPGESTRRTLFAGYKKSARNRGYIFELSREEFDRITNLPCHYCGGEPNNVFKDRHRREGDVVYNGVDRKDNTLGYTSDNCLPCCRMCNRAKDIFDYDQFIAWVKRVATIHSLHS